MSTLACRFRSGDRLRPAMTEWLSCAQVVHRKASESLNSKFHKIHQVQQVILGPYGPYGMGFQATTKHHQAPGFLRCWLFLLLAENLTAAASIQSNLCTLPSEVSSIVIDIH